jgi:ATP-binding cassette subfamily C protein PrsD
MSVAQGRRKTAPSARLWKLLPAAQGDDPVANGLRESARRMTGVAVFSGVINVLMLSGSFYMLQVYDRVIPSRNIATLLGLSLLVLFAYLVQGYFDALRTRMLCRVATLFDAGLQESIHNALATLPLRGVKPMLMQQPLRDLDQVRTFLSGMGPTAFLDMPWIPIFVVILFLFHPAIGMTALLGTAAIVVMTLLTERISRGATRAAMDSSAQRQVLADATQRNAEVIQALGMVDRFTARWSRANEQYLQENIRVTDVYANLGSGAKVLRYVLQSGMLGIGAYLVVARHGVGRHHDRLLHHHGPRAGPRRGRIGELEATGRRAARDHTPARNLQGDGETFCAASGAAASVPRAFRREPCRGGTGHGCANPVGYFLLAQGRLGPGIIGRERVRQDITFKSVGRNLARQAWGDTA